MREWWLWYCTLWVVFEPKTSGLGGRCFSPSSQRELLALWTSDDRPDDDDDDDGDDDDDDGDDGGDGTRIEAILWLKLD